MDSYEESLEKLRHALSYILYNPKTVQSPFYCTKKGKNSCKNHLLKHTEEFYGKVLMRFSVCRKCGYGTGELFPPNQKREVLTH